MIVENNNIGSQSNQKTVDFELDNSGGHLFSVLSQLYSRPVDSTIRELATNCGDAHIMSNNTDRPFIIRLPNFNKDILTLCFRDFGPGLSHNEVMNIYRIYGKSTKTNSNSVTGCLGLGSKSPYSISSTFYVKSYKNGKCSQYTCSMDNNSIPNITETPIITETHNENGLEVIIPFYKEVDFKKILPDVLKYFKIKPLVYLQQGDLEQDTPVDIKWHEIKDVKFLTKTIAISGTIDRLSGLINRGNGSNIIPNEVIQLQIYYPLDKTLILDTIKRYNKLYTNETNDIVENFHIDKDIEKIIKFMLNVGIQLHAEPGKIAFAPSRETIKYTDLTLIYIVRELIKAARIFKKIYIKMLSKLDSYEKIFKYIYLESDDYKLLVDTFDISKLKNIVIFSSIFKRKFKPNLILGKVSGNELRTALTEYKIYMDPIEEMDLYSFKNTFGNCFRTNSVQQYVNIFDPNLRKVEQANISTAMVVNGATPFLNSLIMETTKKIYIKTLAALYQETFNIIEKLFNLSDIDFMAYSDSINVFKIFEFNHDEYKISTKEEKAILKQQMIDIWSSWTYMDFAIAVNRVRSIDSKSQFGRIATLLNYMHTLMFNWGFYNNNRSSEKLIDAMPELKKAQMSNILETYHLYSLGVIQYKDIIMNAGITYQKMFRQQQNAKNKFWTVVNNLQFNFDNVVENFVNFRIRDIDKLPLDGLAGIKKGDAETTEVFIANVAIWIFYKYYRNEVEIQNEYHIKNDIGKLLKDELVSHAILPEYLQSLKPAKKQIIQRNSSPKFSFNKTNAGEITNSSIWYHDELNKENLAYLYDDIRNYLDKINHSLRCMVKINKDSHKWLSTAKDGNILSRNDYLGSNPFILNEYLERLKYVARKYKPDLKPTIENWNNAVDTLSLLISIDKDICGNELKYHSNMRALMENSQNLSENKDSKLSFEYEDNKYTLIHLHNNRIIVTRHKEKFILLDTTSFRIPSEIRDEFQTRLFSENKICLLNSNLKINIGINPFPELIDLKEIQATHTDAKMRKHKNRFYEDVSFVQLETILKSRFPDFIFLNYIDNYPTKLIKTAYNPIPLMIKLMTDEKLNDDLLKISLCYNNTIASNLPVSGFFKPTENSHYSKDLVDYLRDDENKNYFKTNSLSQNAGAFMLALGKRNHVSFKTFEKFISTFGNEEVLKEYHFIRDYTYNGYKTCMKLYAEFEGFKKHDELNIESLKNHIKNDTLQTLSLSKYFDLTGTNISQILKFYRYLKTFVENYVNGSTSFTGKLIDAGFTTNKYELEFKNIMKTRSNFKHLIDRIDVYCSQLKKGRGNINLEDVKQDFLDYLKPTKTCQKNIIEFKNQDEFFDKLNKIKRTEILNKKINRRSKK